MKSSRLLTPVMVAAILAALVFALALAGCGAENGTGDGKGEGDGRAVESEKLTWPIPYRDSVHSGRSAVNGPSSPQIIWTADVGARTQTSWPVLTGDGNLVNGFQGKVTCLDASDGTVAWEFATGSDAATTCVVAEDGTVYAGAGTRVHALSPSGTEKWSYDVGSETDGPTLAEDGTVYAGSAGGRLVALSPKGKLVWERQVTGSIRSPSVDEEGNLYCGAVPLVLHAFDRDGEKLWEFKPEGELQAYEGLFPWANSLETPAIAEDGTIYVGSGVQPTGVTTTGQMIEGYAMPQRAKLYAVTAGGEKKWEYAPQYECSYSVHTPSMATDGTLYAGTSCWRVLAIDPQGDLVWEFNTDEGKQECPSVWSPSIGKDGLLYAATTNARIFCITPEGAEKWRYVHDTPWLDGGMGGSNNFSPPPIDEGGTLFSVLSQGTVFAFRSAAAGQ